MIKYIENGDIFSLEGVNSLSAWLQLCRIYGTWHRSTV